MSPAMLDVSVDFSNYDIPMIHLGETLDKESGELIRALLKSLASRGYCRISLDLGDVKRITQDGMSELVVAYEEQRARRGRLRVDAASPEVRGQMSRRGLTYMTQVCTYSLAV